MTPSRKQEADPLAEGEDRGVVGVVWVLEDPERPGGVETVVRSLDQGLGMTTVDSRTIAWWASSASNRANTDGTPVSWVWGKFRYARRRSRGASGAAKNLDRLLETNDDLIAVLDPGSIEVARRLNSSRRWGVHIHWSPELILRPWLYADEAGMPALVRCAVQIRLRWVGRRNARLLSRAPFLVTLTSSHTAILEKLNPRVVEIPNPVPLGAPRAPRAPAGDSTTIGFVGRLSPEKGPDILLDAFELVARECGGCQLVIAGAGEMEAMLGEHPLAEHPQVRFAGWLDDPQAFLRSLDVLVLPSRTEAVPLVLLEGLNAGCAVVACDAGPGVRDVLRQGILGRIVPREDPAALAEAILEAVADRRCGLGPSDEEVRNALLSHDPKEVVLTWQALLNELATSSPPGAHGAAPKRVGPRRGVRLTGL
jgi:glycosyltransferase involved in cell wall biosynthesis